MTALFQEEKMYIEPFLGPHKKKCREILLIGFRTHGSLSCVASGLDAISLYICIARSFQDGIT